jgi:hypothetical protein
VSEGLYEIYQRILKSYTTPLVNRIGAYLLATEFIDLFCPCHVLSFSCGETGSVCACVCFFVLRVYLTLFIERKKRYHSKNERNVTEPVVCKIYNRQESL